MNDEKIRASFKKLYLKKVTVPCLIFDEMGVLGGKAIADIAAVCPNLLECFEIKSADDTLIRLPNQIASYNKIFDYISIITEEKYIQKVANLVPSFWGIIFAKELESGEVSFFYSRLPSLNLEIDPKKQVQLLWKAEAQQLLYEMGIRGISKLSRSKLWDLIVKNSTADELRNNIYITLKRRINWKKPL